MKNSIRMLSVLAVCFVLSAPVFGNDILIADFEGDDYGKWKTTGEAFGNSPAKGALKSQHHVSGYKGKGLVNTYLNGDDTTGTLTSPKFEIERNYITFLIGGGSHKDTCIRLVVGDNVVASRSGNDDEQLTKAYFDVKKYKGKTAQLQIVDNAKGGWGHVNVDHILLTDEKPKAPVFGKFQRDFEVDKKFLIIPITNGAKKCQIEVSVDGEPVRRYQTELARDPDNVDWWAFFTIEQYKGRPANVSVNHAAKKCFDMIKQADKVPGSDTWGDEKLRPQFHFSQKVGWNNDPNGMVYYDGEWHLFFQHNPVGHGWGNMTWGHAVSKDLVHWKQLPNALFPRTMAKNACFSGSGTIDKNNTAGFKTGKEDVMIAAFTDTGCGEAIAYSNDRGRTFTYYEGNPVVKHSGRDPKVFWYEPEQHWVMAVFNQNKKHGKNIAIYTSNNLKEWTEQSHVPGYFECPELFELPVDGDRNETRWVLFAANAQYAIGSFDGKKFTPVHEGKHRVHWGKYYASQTFDNPPDGRKIQIGWVRIGMPGMPFNQTFSFPHRLTLRTTDDGIRMFAEPVKEIENIHAKKHAADAQQLDADDPVALEVSGELFDVRATFETGDAKRVGLDIGGNRVTYEIKANKLNGARMKPVDGKVTIQVLLDRPMMEVCGNNGRVYITTDRRKKGEVEAVKAFAEGSGAKLVKLEVYELESIWKGEYNEIGSVTMRHERVRAPRFASRSLPAVSIMPRAYRKRSSKVDDTEQATVK